MVKGKGVGKQYNNGVLDSLHFFDLAASSCPMSGTLMLSLDKSSEATLYFHRAFELSREFSAHQGLVSCYLASKRNKEALLVRSASLYYVLPGLVETKEREREREIERKERENDERSWLQIKCA